MKKYFIDFLKAFCAYDEFIEAFTLSNKFFDFDYYIKFTDPQNYVMGAFPPLDCPFSSVERFVLYKEWRDRLNEINHDSNS